MKTLRVLNIEDMFKLNILYCHKQLPVYFEKFNIIRHSGMHNYATRSNSFVPRNVTRLHASRRCLRNHVSVVLNNTCNNIINKIDTYNYEGFAAYGKKLFHPIPLNVALKIVMFAHVIFKYAIRKLLCVYIFKEPFHSSINYDGYLMTPTYCIEVLPLIV